MRACVATPTQEQQATSRSKLANDQHANLREDEETKDIKHMLVVRARSDARSRVN